MIKIGNIKTFVPDGSIAIKVDRSSPLGNPYMMHNESERDTVCDWYDDYFYDIVGNLHSISKNNRFVDKLESIFELAKTEDITLLCWCYPKRCHAETIKRYLEERLVREDINQ